MTLISLEDYDLIAEMLKKNATRLEAVRFGSPTTPPRFISRLRHYATDLTPAQAAIRRRAEHVAGWDSETNSKEVQDAAVLYIATGHVGSKLPQGFRTIIRGDAL